MDLPNLYYLDLSANKIHGQISNTIFYQESLEFLDLSENYINGIAEFDEFGSSTTLTFVDISSNQLTEFPKFLKNQLQLEYLNLSNNKIHGQVPEWMWNTKSLVIFDLSNNLLTGFWQDPIFLEGYSLQVLDLRSNLLQGSLPIPPISTSNFYISNNSLIGNIPELFCNLSSLLVIDLANNSLSGSLPRCSKNFGTSLLVLDLGRNKFRGSIPKTWIGRSKLMIINFSQNQFQGH
jgi:Leucine-rich repeat (LRR) protein